MNPTATQTGKPIRVLHVLNNLGSGGAESLIMNLYRTIDRAKVQFDFMLRSSANNFHEEEIKQLGGRIYIMPPFPRQLLGNIKAVNRFFASHPQYTIIHVHANALIYTIPLILAKKHGIRCRIIHSHNSSTLAGGIGHLLHKVNRFFITSWATDFFACSPIAARWMFGNRPYTYIKNGIDLLQYRHSVERRKKVRDMLGIGDELVVGHVGRLVPAKNHDWILTVFRQMLASSPNAKLLLVGEGSLQADIEQRIKRDGMERAVIMAGSIHDVNAYLDAMDVFVFPSHYEGLPVSLIEAQANGLPCVISDAISPDCIVSDGTIVLSLTESAETWVDALLNRKRNDGSCLISDSCKAFDIQAIAKNVENFYCMKSACAQD